MRRRKDRHQKSRNLDIDKFYQIDRPNITCRKTYKYSSGSDVVDDIFYESVECLNSAKECLDKIFDFFS
jgi:hypothetical protein